MRSSATLAACSTSRSTPAGRLRATRRAWASCPGSSSNNHAEVSTLRPGIDKIRSAKLATEKPDHLPFALAVDVVHDDRDFQVEQHAPLVEAPASYGVRRAVHKDQIVPVFRKLPLQHVSVVPTLIRGEVGALLAKGLDRRVDVGGVVPAQELLVMLDGGDVEPLEQASRAFAASEFQDRGVARSVLPQKGIHDVFEIFRDRVIGWVTHANT